MIDESKTPGAPSCYSVSVNRDLDSLKGPMYEVVNNRLEMCRRIGEFVWKSGCWFLDRESQVQVAQYLVESGCSDAVLLSRKGEGRKVGKAPRLVSQVSVINATEARIISNGMLMTEQTEEDCPTAVALDLTTPEVTHAMWREFNSIGKLESNDIQGFEYSFNEGDMNVVTFGSLIRMKLAHFTDGIWQIYRNKRRHAMTLIGHDFCRKYRLCQMPEGELVVPPAGQMSSGHYRTFSDNSFARAFLSESVHWDYFNVSVKYVKTGGDDCLDVGKIPPEVYLHYGKVVTDQETCEGSYSFCSTRFVETGCYQENIGKALFGALYRGSISPSMLSSFVACFRHHPQFAEALEVLNKLERRED